MTSSELTTPRRRGLLILAVVFIAGGLAGAAADRLYVVRQRNAAADLAMRQLRERRGAGRGRSAEIEVPFALARLDLTAEQQQQIRQIVMRFRPITDSIWNSLRPRAQALETQLFQESLCVLTPAQLEEWKEYQRKSDFPESVTTARLQLVATGNCPKAPTQH